MKGEPSSKGVRVIIFNQTFLRDIVNLQLTLELTHGKKSPMLKIPREAPCVIPLKLMDICKEREKALVTKCIWF
jgi:hypothetical protein